MFVSSDGYVKRNLSDEINKKIEQETEARVRYLSLRDPAEIEDRLRELNKEWDIERTLLVNASTLALTGILLGAFHDKKWLALSAVASSFLVQHSIRGRCLPTNLLRKMGIRKRDEIEKERLALKAMRGDFKDVASEKNDLKRADKALKAVLGM